MKPTPLPPHPKLIDRVEYGLQWAVLWAVVDIKGHPMVSGICTGLLLAGPICGLGWVVSIGLTMLTGHWK
jgi:hypothetical protein